LIMFALMILSLMHCIVHTYMHRKTKKNLKFLNHVVASLAFLRLSLEHIGCIHLHMEQLIDIALYRTLVCTEFDTLVKLIK